MMVYNLFYFQKQKNYLIKFSIITFLILLLTQSKSGFIFYIFSILFYFFKISFRKQILIFLIINLVIILISFAFYKKFKNPYNQTDKEYIAKVYKAEICNNSMFGKFKSITSCNYKNVIFFQIFGVSTYLKLYSIGYTANDIFKNLKIYLLPNSLTKRLLSKELSVFEINNHLSAHNFFLKGILHYGFIFFILFLFNIYILFKNKKNYNIFPALISVTFIGIDIFLFLPILIMSYNYEQI